MRTRFICLYLIILICVPVYAQVVVPTNDATARSFYENSQLVITKQVIDATELAGCLVLRKQGEPDQYLNILPEELRKTLRPQNLSTKAYRTMLSQGEAAKVGFLGLLGVSTKKDNLLEVSITDVWRLDGPSFMSSDPVKANVLMIGKIYRDLGCSVWYNQAVQYSTLVTSQYRKNERSAALTFTYLDGDGKRYVQEESYTQKELVSIAPFDLTPLLDKLAVDKSNKSSALSIDPDYLNKIEIKHVPGGALNNPRPVDLSVLLSAAEKFAEKNNVSGVDKLITGL